MTPNESPAHPADPDPGGPPRDPVAAALDALAGAIAAGADPVAAVTTAADRLPPAQRRALASQITTLLAETKRTPGALDGAVRRHLAACADALGH